MMILFESRGFIFIHLSFDSLSIDAASVPDRKYLLVTPYVFVILHDSKEKRREKKELQLSSCTSTEIYR